MDGDDADVLKNLKHIFNLLPDAINRMPDHCKGNSHQKVCNQIIDLKRKFGKVAKRPVPRAANPASTASVTHASALPLRLSTQLLEMGTS